MIQCLPMMLFQLIHALLATMMCAPGWTWRRQWDILFWAQAYGHQILLGNIVWKADTWIFTFVALPKNIITMKTWTLWTWWLVISQEKQDLVWSWVFLFKVFIEWVLLYVESYVGAAYRSVFKPDLKKKREHLFWYKKQIALININISLYKIILLFYLKNCL